jgi:hypothetical protein
MEVRLLQPGPEPIMADEVPKALALMVVTELGIVTEVRFLQPAKVLPSIVVIELGIITEVRLLQS